MDEHFLDSSIRYLKGVGEAREKLFNKLGIATLRDLVGFFPRAYEDRTVFKKIDSLTVGESVCVSAMAAAKPVLSQIRKGLSLVKFNAVDDTGSLEITFFNTPFVKDAIKQGESYVFYGKISGTLLRPEMTNPIFEREGGGQATGSPYAADSPQATGSIVPIYPLTARLTQKAVSTAVFAALQKNADTLPDVLPSDIVTKHKLCRARYAYFNIHFPQSFKDLDIARRRLIFEELFVLVTAMKQLRDRRDEKAGKCLQIPDFSEFYRALPYSPTNAQIRAINEAAGDMSSGKLMNRLIQGDVGSGKTLVAAALAWAVRRTGAQTAFMAPTEILAKQHAKTLTALLEPLGLRVGLLTGSMTAKGKRETYERLKYGEIDLIVGTHALLSEGVQFSNLALVVTDEQHRFGVAQRAMLAEKGESPHILVMSATPIPRTLALIIYGDLSVSVIDEMPPGRGEIETHIIGESHRERAYNFVRKLVGEGRQVYIICPMVEELDGGGEPEAGGAMSGGNVGGVSGNNSATGTATAGSATGNTAIKSVKEYHETLSKKVFPDLSVALVHGKMAAKAKDSVMADFAVGKVDVLVATTVVEVGVDVPNAALMLIENADRFGLSQLHQLRGRIGRGKHKSYCILIKTYSYQDNERLHIMKSTNDGFKIAEEDLNLRGPGDFFGSRQHGLPVMRIANLMTDMIVLQEAERAAEEVLDRDSQLALPEHRRLSEEIKRMFAASDLPNTP